MRRTPCSFRMLARFSILLLVPLLLHLSAAAAPPDAGPVIHRLHAHLDEDDPRQLPMKLRAIVKDEYSFFRGTADLFFTWCKSNAPDWQAEREAFVMLHGDIHLGNIGTHRVVVGGKPRITFGLVDFDEAVEGPFQLDLLRGAVSLRYSAKQNGMPLDNASWTQVVGKLHDGYREALEGRISAEKLPEHHPIIRLLLAEAAKDSIQKQARKYADLKSLRFHRVRYKKKKPSDLMEPVSTETRNAVVKALQEARSIDGEPFDRAFGLANGQAPGSVVSDVVRWTRLGSAGSQGLDKYLILLNPAIIGKKSPLMIELKEEPNPAAARAGLLAAANGGLDRARQVAEAHASLWLGKPHHIGYTSIGSKGFLVRAKGPWGEELSSEHFQGVGAFEDAALLMGRVIGLSHLHALKRRVSSTANNVERSDAPARIAECVGEIASRLSRSAKEIERLGPLADVHLMQQFQQLRSDERIERLVAAADAYILKHMGRDP